MLYNGGFHFYICNHVVSPTEDNGGNIYNLTL